MRRRMLLTVEMLGLILAGLLGVSCDSLAQTPADASQIQTSNLDQQIRDFLQREVTAHVSDKVNTEELRRWLEGLNDEDLGRYKM